MGATWNLVGYFDEFDGARMRVFKTRLGGDMQNLLATGTGLAPLTASSLESWEAVVLASEDLAGRLEHFTSYIECLEAAHTGSEAYSRERAWTVARRADYEKLEVSLMLGLHEAGDDVFERFCARRQLSTISYFLNRLRLKARQCMPIEMERLAADLNMDGLSAWGRLYDSVSGSLEFDLVTPEGGTQKKPIAQWRALMSDPDRRLGRAAYDGGNRAWEGVADTCAAALNALAGTRLTLNRHRGIDHFLTPALFQAAVAPGTLEAMYRAIYARLDLAREIVRVRSGFLGRPGMWFFEREAPLPLKDTGVITWKEACGLVAGAFERSYPDLGAYFREFVERRWIESEARPGKRPGAFCTSSPLTGEQRVFMTFSGTLNDVTTMAHEVGHAWHAHLLGQHRPLLQQYPMTLAETASIFAEHILAESIYADAETADIQKLHMLDTDLSGAAVLLLDITTRFEFEKAFYSERQAGEVSPSRLKELMVQTQNRIYADALLPDGADPLFWASKLHFYISEVSFYNFPYTFGFLLARALVAMFLREGDAFLPRYENFLKSTGSDTAENVARRALGVDLGSERFWTEAIDSLQAPLSHFTEMLQHHPHLQ